jgi:hypothetical protein
MTVPLDPLDHVDPEDFASLYGDELDGSGEYDFDDDDERR